MVGNEEKDTKGINGAGPHTLDDQNDKTDDNDDT